MANSESIKLSIPATYVDVRAIDEAVVNLLRRQSGVDEELIRNVELAVHEICANVVEHAYAELPGGEIQATIAITGLWRRTLTVELRDGGRPFDAAAVGEVDLVNPHEGGYGMYLARALLDEVHYERRADANVWRLIKNL